MIAHAIRSAVALALFSSLTHAAAPPAASLEAANKALESGDAVSAVTIYEALTQQGESLEAELGLVKAALQAGEFRKAMSWATLVAGEHKDSAEAVRLLAYMQDRIGRSEHATTLLKESAATSGSLSPAPPRVHFEPFPAEGRHILSTGNGLIVDNGTRVLTYSGVIPEAAGALYVRNGLGKVRRAEREPGATRDIVKLRLAESFAPATAFPREQFIAPEGTRFCFALGYGPLTDPRSIYPAVAPGIVFRADAGVANLMQVTSAIGAGNAGSPIFDARGRFMGVAVGNGDIVIGGKNLRRQVGQGTFAIRITEPPLAAAKAAPPTPAGKQPPMPAIEELYERLLPSLVQIVAVQ